MHAVEKRWCVRQFDMCGSMPRGHPALKHFIIIVIIIVIIIIIIITRLASLVSSMYVVNLLLCICFGYSGMVHTAS